MKVIRNIIEINEELCNGCGNCVPACAEGAIEIIDGKAKVIKDMLCDGLGACIGDCPEGALKIIQREAEDFNEAAVEDRLEELKAKKTAPAQACGCPSAEVKSFPMTSGCREANTPASFEESESALTQWPVQIRLVPPTAPFLNGADLLVAADCVPVAYPSLHKNMLKGKAVMIGCPKFDNAQEYIGKFTEVFKTADIKSVTVAVMEVPCCSSLPVIVKRAMELSGKNIPVEEVVVSLRGKLL